MIDMKLNSINVPTKKLVNIQCRIYKYIVLTLLIIKLSFFIFLNEKEFSQIDQISLFDVL